MAGFGCGRRGGGGGGSGGEWVSGGERGGELEREKEEGVKMVALRKQISKA